MSDSGENKYKWTPESTSLLVSVWTDRQVQKQLEYSAKPQLIWESVAKYMIKKGYNVTGKQCRSRMKQVLVCYREAKKTGTKAGVEQYYESIDRVLKTRKIDHLNNNHGIDTVDSTANLKSPPKEVKTNKNLQMRCKFQHPPESVYRTEALSPVWSGGRDEDYPDSPESNETVLAQPFRVMSPVRDAATNTTQHQLGHKLKKISHLNGIYEEPIKETYRQNTYSNNYFSEIPFQNTVQNVQNQIIQENMQQNQALLQQNLLQNQLLDHNRLQMNPILRQNVQNMHQGLFTDQGIISNQTQVGLGQNMIAENVLRMQNKCQTNSIGNRAMPQEPRKSSFRQNLGAAYRQFQDQNYNGNLSHLGFVSPSISPDIATNMNDAFCQSSSDKGSGLNDSSPVNVDMTGITNNATFNDDTISIEFLQDSPTPDAEPTKLKDFAVNTDEVPNAPLRKKKAEKLERLMMNAINSQNDVVNKILAAQNEMVTRVLDLDRDRQNRLENRLDHLLDVVQTAVLNKSSEKSMEIPPPLEPLITNLVPPPKPGVVPPKLDLVPPKPCRVPCTANNNCQPPINQNPITTRPGVVSPIMSPSKRVGTIWQKLGPVSTSPFVRAQQQLGFRPVHAVSNEARTQSSAERRIAKEFEAGMDIRTQMYETANFLDAERQLQEDVENARIKANLGQELQARRRLFTQREPNAAMVLSAAFIEAEIQSMEIIENATLASLKKQRQCENDREVFKRPANQYKYDGYNGNNNNLKHGDDKILAGQGENYERMRQLNMCQRAAIGDPCESSTPAKPSLPPQRRDLIETDEPRQTIQQLAQLVMNSARWRNNAMNDKQIERKDLSKRPETGPTKQSSCPETDMVILRNAAKEATGDNGTQYGSRRSEPIDGNAKAFDWLQDRYSYGRNTMPSRASAPPQPASRPLPMGFTTEFLNTEANNNLKNSEQDRRVGFVFDLQSDKDQKERFTHDRDDPLQELQQLYIQKQLKLQQSQGLPFMIHNGRAILAQSDMIERYMEELYSKCKTGRDNDDSDDDEEFLDTTTSMPSSRKNSLPTAGTKTGKTEAACIIS